MVRSPSDSDFGPLPDTGDFAQEGGLRYMRGLRDGMGRSVPKKARPGIRVPKQQSAQVLRDEKVDRYTMLLGGTDQARQKSTKVLKWMQNYPGASFPEGLAYAWLEGQQEPFLFQAFAYGGRVLPGGVIPDFVLTRYGLVWSIIGTYWHSTERRQDPQRDERARQLLIGAQVAGTVINDVVEIYEHIIYNYGIRHEIVFERALSGISIRF